LRDRRIWLALSPLLVELPTMWSVSCRTLTDVALNCAVNGIAMAPGLLLDNMAACRHDEIRSSPH
jgi:hypothetical protein